MFVAQWEKHAETKKVVNAQEKFQICRNLEINCANEKKCVHVQKNAYNAYKLAHVQKKSPITWTLVGKAYENIRMRRNRAVSSWVE